MSVLRKTQQWGTFARVWHIFDANWQDPFLAAPLISRYLMGKHKPIYHPMADCGDHVVVINSKDIALRGDDWTKRVYFHHTGYAGGATWTLAWELHQKDATKVVSKAVYRAMKGTLQRRYTMQRLHVYADDQVPENIMANVTNQIQQLRPIPERLDHIPAERIAEFPRLIKYPEDYMPKEPQEKIIRKKERRQT